MPELPEVETIRQVLEKKITGLKIIRADLRVPKMAASRWAQNPRSQAKQFVRQLQGRTIIRLRRRAKYLIADLDQGSLVFHLGMTGQLFVARQGERLGSGWPSLPDKHTHLILNLSKGKRLFFRDIRKFGRLRYLASEQETVFFQRLGPEPLGKAFTPEVLQQGLRGKKAGLKAALLNQKVVAGLGNIYVDEALFRAGLAPQRMAGAVSKKKINALHAAIQAVLKAGIRFRGTTFSDYYDPESRRGGFQKYLQVYGRKDERCFKCSTKIRKAVVAQRGTHWCPKCQK
ncbi:bifunctional DNA-formamidopyrimidine glycosylase/DNA-(apurinic or apyrimidinic site) lyase [bacterium]|nr:bifunctional DNA-formamidopyrimidine glycosylase/DNA-(apurinic or apyrimidinic site) lyase [bacterium]